MPKPLPPAVLSPNKAKKSAVVTPPTQQGIVIGDDASGNSVCWNPTTLPNGHAVLIGASGSGKTQTLKAIAYELPNLFPEIRLVIIDFHGDQQLPNEICYPLDMESSWGINPLNVDLDKKGGGPALQAIAVSALLKKALTMGANQEGMMISILTSCYAAVRISQDDPKTWNFTPPTFANVQEEIEQRIEDGCKESAKLQLKLAATFQYGIFARPQPPLDAPIIRFNLSALGKVPGLGAIAAESLIKQLLDSHRLMGESASKTPRTCLFIDEAKEVKGSRSVDLVLADGRKYGLNAVLASQRDAHISDNVIANSATKIVLSVDQTEVARVSKRFRFADSLVANLQPLDALIRMGTDGHRCKIMPYYQRVSGIGEF